MKAVKATVISLGFALSAGAVDVHQPANVTETAVLLELSLRALTNAKTAALIDPELRPESDGEFFKKDYPVDDAHGHELKTKHPYPVVQPSDTFDKDYVKDENNNKMDGAAWDNMLKHGRDIKKAAEEVEKLKEKVKKAKEDASKAEDKLAKGAKDVKEAEDALDKAAAEKKKEEPATTSKREESTTPKPPKTTTLAPEQPIDTDGAAKQVDNELGDLERCQEELRIAKEKLEKLQKEAAEAQAAMKEKEALRESAEHAEAIAKEEEEKLEVVVKKEEADYNKAEQRHEDVKAELEAMKKELQKAEDKLRRFRGETVPQRGGGKESGATRTALAGAAALFSFVCLTA